MRRESIFHYRLLILYIFLFTVMSFTAAAQCVTPLEDEVISTTTTICPATYTFSDSNTNGALRITADNLVLDCNGAVLQGSGLTNSIGIYNNYTNVTIKNCIIKNYWRGIRLAPGTTKYNNSILNNSFSNGYTNILGTNQANLIIANNSFFNCTVSGTVSYGIFLTTNTIGNNLITNNHIDGNSQCFAGVMLDYATLYTNVTNNYIENVDTGIFAKDSANLLFHNNTIVNATAKVDYYAAGITLQDMMTNTRTVSNITITHNNITKAGSAGITITRGENIWMSNNYISMLTYDEKLTNGYEVDDGGDPACAVQVLQLRKGYFDDSTESTTPLTYLKAHNATSINVSLYNTTLGSDTECYLRTQNANLTTDLFDDYPNYWHKNYNPAKAFMDDYDVYVSNNIDFLYSYRPYPSFYGTEKRLFFVYGTPTPTTRIWVNYSISKGFMNFTLNNVSLAPHLIGFGNLTLHYNDIFNRTSGQILATNQSAYNVTLSPGDEIYVADFTDALNFSVTAPEAIIKENTIPFAFSAVSNNGVSISTYYFSDGINNYTSPGTYIATTPGDYTFTLFAIDDIGSISSYILTTTITARGSYMSDTGESLMTVVAFIGVIIAVIFGGIVLSMIKNDNFDAVAMKDAIYIIVISMMVLAVGILIFSIFGQI